MARQFVDITVYTARKMAINGNIDQDYWFDKTLEERLSAAIKMIEVAFKEPLFTQKKVDRSMYFSRKRSV